MKVKITKTYNLNDESDTYEYNRDIVAREENASYSIYTHDFESFLRQKLKYEQLSEAEYKIYEEVRAKYFELKNQYTFKDE